MSFFCPHEYRPKKVLHGESFIDDCWAVAFYCIRCDKRKIGRRFSSRQRALEHLDWLLKEQL